MEKEEVSSETSVKLYRATWRNIPEDSLYSDRSDTCNKSIYVYNAVLIRTYIIIFWLIANHSEMSKRFASTGWICLHDKSALYTLTSKQHVPDYLRFD
jgi:hypothetical protein